MTSRDSVRGLSARTVVQVIAILLLLSVAVFWLVKDKWPVSSASFDLAKRLPEKVVASWMLDSSSVLDGKAALAKLEEGLASLPAENREEVESWAKRLFGESWREVAKSWDGRAALAIIDDAENIGVLAIAGLKEPSAVEAALGKGLASNKMEQVDSVKLYRAGEEIYVGYDSSWLYLCDSKKTLQLQLEAIKSGHTFAKDPPFTEAIEKIGSKESLGFFYWDLNASLRLIRPLNPPSTDDRTFSELGCLQYLAADLDIKKQSLASFLRVDPKAPGLGEKMLTPGQIKLDSFSMISGKTELGSAVDVKWLYEVLLALAAAFPDSRQAAAMVPAGLAVYGNPFGALNGDLEFSSDLMHTLPSIFGENFAGERAQGQLTACRSNEKNIATALEMYATDNDGRYPISLAALTPNYLKKIPSCPAAGKDSYSPTYRVLANPNHAQFACAGNNHQQAKKNLPSYDTLNGLNPGNAPGPSSPSKEEEPNIVISASVKDVSYTHQLLKQLIGGGVGGEPEPGKEKTYELPGASAKLLPGEPPHLVVTMGPKASKMLALKEASMTTRKDLKQALSSAKEGAIYASYADFSPLVTALEQAAKQPAMDEPAIRTSINYLKKVSLKGTSIAWTAADGVYTKSDGLGPIVIGLGAGVGAGILIPNFVRARGQGQLTACKSNLKNIGTALEMYSTDNGGRYPKSLAALTPNYLRAIPICPAAGASSYKLYTGKDAPGNAEHLADYYYVECHGANHESLGLEPNFPAYDAISGLENGPFQ